MDIRDDLPNHPPQQEQLPAADDAGALRYSGLVAQPGRLSPTRLAALPRRQLAERFACEEGWAVDGLVWEGIPLAAVVACCQPLPTARYVLVVAGGYRVALALAEVDRALLCDHLKGEPLTVEHGAPWRLVLSGGACFTSVKWVSALEFAAEATTETGEQIARDRLATANGAD